MSAEDVVDDHAVDLTDPTGLRRPLPGPLGRLRPWIDWFGLRRVLAGLATVVVVVVGGWWLLRSPAPPTEAGLPYASPATTTSTPGSTPVATAAVPSSITTGPIVVHVAGAVARPGVYELPGDARVHTAIEMAGGWRPEADPSALNLAAVVADGERIYVPVTGETVPLPPVVPGAADAAATGRSGRPQPRRSRRARRVARHRAGDGGRDRRPSHRARTVRRGRRPRGGQGHRAGQAGGDPRLWCVCERANERRGERAAERANGQSR